MAETVGQICGIPVEVDERYPPHTLIFRDDKYRIVGWVTNIVLAPQRPSIYGKWLLQFKRSTSTETPEK